MAESPGSQGADIAVGEGQPLACPPQFGGPGVGIFACHGDRNYLQQLPGRVCGETVDSRGPRDGRYIEQLGTYDPLKEGTNYTIDLAIADKWLAVGAKPSETVNSMIRKARPAAAANA